MNKKLFISTLLLTSIMSVSMFTMDAKAATSASQTVTATLGTTKSVQTNGGTIASTIDDDGNLLTSLTPAFLIITNTAASQNMTLTATANVSGGTTVNAFSGNGTTNYLTLTNNTVLPAAAAVTNAQSASPVVASNANVITYPMTIPTTTTGVISYTWNSTSSLWNIALTNKGNLTQTYTIPTGAAKSGTYSGDDEAGAYKATLTLSFV